MAITVSTRQAAQGTTRRRALRIGAAAGGAVAAVAGAIRRSWSAQAGRPRPVGSFLFLGPAGVGKTALAKALAEIMFGSQDAMIRLDMREYVERHSIARLTGAPPGDDGQDRGARLAEAVRRRPHQVILFDEVDEARPGALDMVGQILRGGRLADGHGRTVDVRHTVVILASAAGAAGPALKRAFPPGLLDHVDEIVLFNHLDREQRRRVVEMRTRQRGW